MKKLMLLSLALGLVGCSQHSAMQHVSVIGTQPLKGASHFEMKQYQVEGQPVEDSMYFFDLNKNVLKSDDKEKLDNLATIVGAKNVQIRIEGHTDERGSAEYNVALGWRRAQAIAAYLQSKGVAKSQMWLVSYGKEKPVMYGHNESAWKLNRRAYVSLVVGAQQ